MKTLTRCEIIVQEDAVELLWALLALHISFGWEEESLPTGETLFRIHCENDEFFEKIIAEVNKITNGTAEIRMDKIPDEDWTAAWREFFTPIACGQRFLVLPPWLAENTDLEGRQAIIIEPKSAFGTGHHGTTALCLEVISDLLDSERIKPGMEFLDLGTGSGILGLGCCLSSLYGVGADIDMLAIDNALENKKLNNVPDYNAKAKQGFQILHGSLEVLQERKFDLILANILARPLKELAAEIVAMRKEGACIILSGLLTMQASDVEATYIKQGLAPAKLFTQGDWAALVWE